MAFQIFSQRDPRWAGHALGSGTGELGPYGCYETCLTMVAYDAYPDLHYTPPAFDDLLWSKGVFSGDLLPDNALDRAFPNDGGLGPRFSSHVEAAFNQAHINAAIAAPDEYAVVWIHNPAVGVPGYHAMVMYSPTQVADPWWGKVMTLATWGGPGIVVKTLYVKVLRAQRAAAAAAQAAAAKATADAAAAAAKAKADAEAALAAAQAQAAAAEAAAKAAAEAQAQADAKAAAEAAAADAREAAAHAAADAAARAEANNTPVTAPPTPSDAVAAAAQRFIIYWLLRLLGRVR